MQMRTTLNLDEKLVTRAARLSGIREKTALLHAGLEALIARESGGRRNKRAVLSAQSTDVRFSPK